MIHDMEYDGQSLQWSSRKFRATSGLEGSQEPSEQCAPDKGPVPEGLYRVFIADKASLRMTGPGPVR